MPIDEILSNVPFEFGIGLHLDGDPVLQPFRADAFARERGLGFRQRHAATDDAIMLRRVDQHRAPAAADVEQRLAGLQAQLAADVVELVELRLVDVVGEILEVSAAVDHPLVEEEPVELVRNVVVMGDRLLVRAADERIAAGEALDGRIAAAREERARECRAALSTSGSGEAWPSISPAGARSTMSNSEPFSTSIAFETQSSTSVVKTGRRMTRPTMPRSWMTSTGPSGRTDALAVPQPHREARLQLLDHRPDDPARPLCAVHTVHPVAAMMSARFSRQAA